MIRPFTIAVNNKLPEFRDTGSGYDTFDVARSLLKKEPVGVYVLVDDKSGELSIVRVVPDTYKVEVIG